MSDELVSSNELQDDLVTELEYVAFARVGDGAAGAYHCSGCGYGVTVSTTLPQCPMCDCETWEQAEWSPFSRAALAP
ncbi:MAG TPA: hypothetical protein VLK36_05925 [Gaiellaceae bacterium]|nr:hypothetical protein [Gaiellaceae bacterium]